MIFLNKRKLCLKPMFHTFLYEIKLNIKLFYIFSGFTCFLLILTNFIPYVIIQLHQILPSDLYEFFIKALNYFSLILIFSTSLFFSGILCSDYRMKTGLNLFPLIKKSQLLIGRYLAGLILIIGIVCIQYLSMSLLGYYFYGEPLYNTIYSSFGLTILFVIALSSLITFMSSFIKSELYVIILINGLLLIVAPNVDPIVMQNMKIEPIYSLMYHFNLIRFILSPSFSTIPRYSGNWWLFPMVEVAILTLLIYGITFFILALCIFKKRHF